MISPTSFVKHALPVLALSVLLLGGCAGSLGLFSGPLVVQIEGADDMNAGNAARVRVYELSGETNFRTTTLSSFWRGDEQALGSELVRAPREVLLYPGEAKTVEFDVHEDTRYIGVAADLRDPDREAWRSIYDVEEVDGGEIGVRVGLDRVEARVD